MDWLNEIAQWALLAATARQMWILRAARLADILRRLRS